MAERNLLFRGQIHANYFGIETNYLERLLSTHDMGELPAEVVKEKITNGMFMHIPVTISSEHYRIMHRLCKEEAISLQDNQLRLFLHGRSVPGLIPAATVSRS